nr:MAG TPA: hypothetical protein [Caudoviricetes sp.]
MILALVLILIFLFLILCFLIRFLAKASKTAKEQRKKILQENKEQGIVKRYPPLVHVIGLDIPENVQVSVFLKTDKLTITGAGREYNLNFDKIVSSESHVTMDIREYYRSSTLKGVTGAALFGLPGAVIGSAPTKREVKTDVKSFAVISFTAKTGDIATIILSDVLPNTRYASDLVARLKPLTPIKNLETVNL